MAVSEVFQPANLIYRTATADDASAIIGHMDRVLCDTSTRMCEASMVLPSLDVVYGWLDDGEGTLCFLASDSESQVRGCLLCMGDNHLTKAFIALSVDRGYRRNDQHNKAEASVAQRLLDRGIRWCNENAWVGSLEGCVHPENRASLNFLRRNSFIETGKCGIPLPGCDQYRQRQLYLVWTIRSDLQVATVLP